MLDISFIRFHVEEIKQNCLNRAVRVDIDRLLELDNERRDFVQQIDEFRSVRNRKSKIKPTDEEIVTMREIGDRIAHLEERLAEIEAEYKELLFSVPNLTHPDAPIGSEEAYRVLETHGKIPSFGFEAKDHERLFVEREMLDFERGAKVSGAKFYFSKGKLVRINQALIQYAMDIVEKRGFGLMETPDMAKQEAMDASGFNPRGKESQIYHIEGHDLNLIGTAEITVLGYHANEVLDVSDGPKKYAALSHCFRTEAGAYGRTSKGLYRVHQFTKLELFLFCRPEDSEEMHWHLLAVEKEICDGLGFAYRVIDTPSGDLGGPAYRKFDIEAWMVTADGYGEITSTSNCLDYQARRLNIKYKTAEGKTAFVHTLNGTAMALSRIPIAIVEQFQQKDGRIAVPKVLRRYGLPKYL